MSIELQAQIKQTGLKDGAQWRDEVATKGQLVRLRRFHAERPDFEAWFEDEEGNGSNQTPAHTLAIIIDPRIEAEVGFGPDPVEMFWLEIGGERADVDDPDYLEGFVEGALS